MSENQGREFGSQVSTAAIRRLENLAAVVGTLSGVAPDLVRKMAELVSCALRYEQQHNETIRLVPTEGIQSPAALALMATVMNGRYLHAPPENSAKAIRYPDIAELQSIHKICREALKAVLKAEYVNVDCLAGLQVMQMAIMAFTQPGEVLLCISPNDGGHELTAKMAAQLGRKAEFLPFDSELHVVDALRLDRSKKPALVYLDHSNILRHHDLENIKAVYPSAVLCVDISQVFASVAGGIFPHPLENGADVMVGSTHKSLNGPQKAVAATNCAKLADRFAASTGVFVSNNHPGNVAALAMTLLEFLAYGQDYARAMVGNANALAQALQEEGIPVYDLRSDKTAPYSLSPHVWVDCEKMGWDAESAVQHLYQDAGIVVNTLFLAHGGADSTGAKGLRLGTTEVTRLGMRAAEMREIAKLIALSFDRNGDCGRIRQAAVELRQRFPEPEFCIQIQEAE